eukprot:gene43-46_t
MKAMRSLCLSRRATTTALNFSVKSVHSIVAPTVRTNSGAHTDRQKFNPLAFALAGGMSVALMATQANSAQCEAEMKGHEGSDPYAHTALFPPIQPYLKGMLRVSNIHSIAYSLYGNPKGKPVIFVHGGPGGGTDPVMARYFDPAVYHIILVDQRGAGESTPFADLRENTTYDSVRDFEKLREHLKINKWQVFGGSWGSTLGLAYAIEHPERVTELVLRGVFLLRKKEIDWMYQGPGANFIFPEDWKIYEDYIPPEERNDYIAAYGRRLRGELGEEEMRKAAKIWSIWEGRISKLEQDKWETVKDKFGADDFSLAFGRIENHYFTNHGFFPRDGFLLEEDNLKKIAHIPTVIVQGRYDVVCPAVSAHDLHVRLPKSELNYTLAGHSGFEVANIAELVKATEKFKHR